MKLDRFSIEATITNSGTPATEAHVLPDGEWADAEQSLRIVRREKKKAKRLKAQLAEAKAEVERLAGMIANPRTTGMHVEDSGVLIGLEGIGPRILAETFANDFKRSGATNFLEISMVSKDPEIGELVVTLQRKQGKTPGVLKAEADAALAAAQPAIRFAGTVLKAHRNDGYPGDVDGDAIQTAAVECGLLVERVVSERCGENCSCAEFVGADEWLKDGVRCYFTTDAGKAAIAAIN